MDNRASNTTSRRGPPSPRTRRPRVSDNLRRYASDLEPSSSPFAHSRPHSSSPMLSSRGRIFGSLSGQSRLQQHRMRRYREPDFTNTVQEAVDDLYNETRTAQAALNQTLPVPAAVDEFTGLPEGTESHSRRSKRRKLATDTSRDCPKINYGYHGQVAPTKLNMMVSYTNTAYQDDPQYPQNNILRNDQSVFSTRKNKMDLMLSHWGEIPFTCTKIIIKTPEHGFSAPVQEGMVFLYMNHSNILDSTSQFHLRDTCPHTHSRSPPPELNRRSMGTTRLRMSDGRWQTMDTYESRQTVSSLNADQLETFDFDAFLDGGPGSLHISRPETSSSAHDDMPPLTRVPRRASPIHARSAYEENIRISCELPSDDEEESTPDNVLEDRERRRVQADEDSDDEDDIHYSSSSRSSRQRFHSRPIEWRNQDHNHPLSDLKPPGPDIPYTKFFIERKKHVVTIKFDTPVAAKYILVKLWSPQGRDEIDLQSVSVWGFAGPRFFPLLRTT